MPESLLRGSFTAERKESTGDAMLEGTWPTTRTVSMGSVVVVVVGGCVVVVVVGSGGVEVAVVEETSTEDAGEQALATSASPIATMRVRPAVCIGAQATCKSLIFG
jgi:hypothetical protein